MKREGRSENQRRKREERRNRRRDEGKARGEREREGMKIMTGERRERERGEEVGKRIVGEEEEEAKCKKKRWIEIRAGGRAEVSQ